MIFRVVFVFARSRAGVLLNSASEVDRSAPAGKRGPNKDGMSKTLVAKPQGWGIWSCGGV